MATAALTFTSGEEKTVLLIEDHFNEPQLIDRILLRLI